MRAALEEVAIFTVVGEAHVARESLALCQRVAPDVAIINMEGHGDWLRAAESISENIHGCDVLVLTDVEDEALLVKAVQAGATGYLSHGCSLTDLIEAVQALYRGEVLIPPRMLRGLLMTLLSGRRHQDDALRKAARLTTREREVLAMLGAGGNNDTIAAALVISPQTARTHVRNLLIKLELHSRLEAAAFATKIGLEDDFEAG